MQSNLHFEVQAIYLLTIIKAGTTFTYNSETCLDKSLTWNTDTHKRGVSHDSTLYFNIKGMLFKVSYKFHINIISIYKH